MAGDAVADARGVRQLAGRSEPESGCDGRLAGASNPARGEWHPHAREPEARRAGGEAYLRVRLHPGAVEAERCDRINSGAHRRPLVKAARTAPTSRPPPALRSGETVPCIPATDSPPRSIRGK